MAIRSGLGGQVGLSKETTYGTYVAPTKFVEVATESMQKVVNRIDGGGMAAGRLARLASRRIETNTSGSGSLTMQVPNQGFGVLLENLMGTTVTPVQQGTTTAYLQTHTLADNWGKSFTLQKGVVDIDSGTSQAFNFLGCKITAAEFACGVDEDLQATLEIDARQVEDTSALAAASYPTGLAGFAFHQGTIKIGSTVGTATNVAGVRRVSTRIERPMKTDRFVYNQGGLKDQPILNEYTNISGTFDIDFMNKADFIDRFVDNTQFAVVWEFVGSLIASTYYYTFRVELPACFMDGALPQLDGPDVHQVSVPFVVRSDGTNPVASILYTSTDVTI